MCDTGFCDTDTALADLQRRYGNGPDIPCDCADDPDLASEHARDDYYINLADIDKDTNE